MQPVLVDQELPESVAGGYPVEQMETQEHAGAPILAMIPIALAGVRDVEPAGTMETVPPGRHAATINVSLLDQEGAAAHPTMIVLEG